MMSGAKKMVPKRRFKEFLNTGSWEQRKFGELMTFLNGRAYKQDELLRDGMYKVLRVGNFYTNDSWYYSDLELDDKYYAKNGDLLYTWSATFGPHIWKGEKVIYHYHIWKLVLQDKIDKLFALQLLEVDKASIISDKNGSTMVHITKQGMENKQTILPISLNEQKRIAKFLSSMDNLITLHQLKLDKLQATKKALLQEMFPEEGQDKPKRRFKGFTDAWEQRKLGETFEYLQNNTLSRDSLNYKNSNVKNIHYGDILVKFDELLDGSSDDIPYINSELDLSKFSKSLLRDGDIIFSDTAEDDAVGKAIELWNVNDPFILSGLHTIPCRPLIPFGKGYLGNFLNSNSYRMQLRPLVQGIKVSSISKSALKDTMIEYPKNLDEQEKIGSLFQNLAKMITLHQRKLDKLKNLKQAYLNEMFV